MKITKSQLKRIIQEETEKLRKESRSDEWERFQPKRKGKMFDWLPWRKDDVAAEKAADAKQLELEEPLMDAIDDFDMEADNYDPDKGKLDDLYQTALGLYQQLPTRKRMIRKELERIESIISGDAQLPKQQKKQLSSDLDRLLWLVNKMEGVVDADQKAESYSPAWIFDELRKVETLIDDLRDRFESAPWGSEHNVEEEKREFDALRSRTGPLGAKARKYAQKAAKYWKDDKDHQDRMRDREMPPSADGKEPIVTFNGQCGYRWSSPMVYSLCV